MTRKTLIQRIYPLLFAAVCLLVGTASADIIIDGSPEFIAEVEAGLQKLKDAGSPSKDIVDGLEGSSNDHVITENSGLGSCSYDNISDANSPGAGGTGNGTGTTVNWDPDYEYTYKDGVDRDPCAVLAHELSHAQDGDTGTRDPSPDPGSGIKGNEVKAVTDENKFRKSQELPPRTKYGCDDLPEEAVCPPNEDGLDATHVLAWDDFSGGSAIDALESGDEEKRVVIVAVPIPRRQVKLTATASRDQYMLGEKVEIKLTLTNLGPGAVDLSDILEGNIRVTGFSVDGTSVVPATSAIDFEDDLGFVIKQSLTSVPAGGSVSIPWRSHFNGVFNGEGIHSVMFSNTGDHQNNRHALTRTGSYKISVIYKYAGLSPANPSRLYASKTNTASVSFDIF